MPMMSMAKSRRITKISGNCCNSQTIDGCLYQTCTFLENHLSLSILINIIFMISSPQCQWNSSTACKPWERHDLMNLSGKPPFLNIPSVFGQWGWVGGGVCKRMNKWSNRQGTFQKGASLSNSHVQLNFLITCLQIVHIARFWKLLYGNIVFANCLNRIIANCQTRKIICKFCAW